MEKKIIYTLIVKEKGDSDDQAWTEELTEFLNDDESIHDSAKKIVDNFNRFLKPGEKAREYIDAVQFAEGIPATKNLDHT